MKWKDSDPKAQAPNEGDLRTLPVLLQGLLRHVMTDVGTESKGWEAISELRSVTHQCVDPFRTFGGGRAGMGCGWAGKGVDADSPILSPPFCHTLQTDNRTGPGPAHGPGCDRYLKKHKISRQAFQKTLLDPKLESLIQRTRDRPTNNSRFNNLIFWMAWLPTRPRCRAAATCRTAMRMVFCAQCPHPNCPVVPCPEPRCTGRLPSRTGLAQEARRLSRRR